MFLKNLEDRKETCIIYESVHRVLECLEVLSDKFPERRVAVIREMTKIYEEVTRGTLMEVYEEYYNKDNIKGEFVIVLEASPEEESYDIAELLRIEIEKGLSKKMAVKEVSKRYNLRKNEVYQASLELED